jgi:16S rRNA (guanine1207-N2)-methyltransferase
VPAAELVADPGVLASTPTGEWGGFGAVQRVGGAAVLPWRRDWLDARRAGVEAHADARTLDTGRRFAQCLVHLQKSRDATWNDLVAAWARLEPGGRLLLCGGNALGVASAVKRLARDLEQPGRVLANRRRARIVAFERTDARGPVAPQPAFVALPVAGVTHRLAAAPGVFSARRLDPGTELLLEALDEIERPPERVLDLGCGIGPLFLAALLRWPAARATGADADARAIASARHNATALGVADRSSLVWWDADEPVPLQGADLAVLNPPFHAGKSVDLGPALAMFRHLGEALAPSGTALIVANRTLPYERALAELGRLRTVQETRHYKVLAFRRASRSASERRRHAPGSRSSGSA